MLYVPPKTSLGKLNAPIVLKFHVWYIPSLPSKQRSRAQRIISISYVFLLSRVSLVDKWKASSSACEFIAFSLIGVWWKDFSMWTLFWPESQLNLTGSVGNSVVKTVRPSGGRLCMYDTRGRYSQPVSTSIAHSSACLYSRVCSPPVRQQSGSSQTGLIWSWLFSVKISCHLSISTPNLL